MNEKSRVFLASSVENRGWSLHKLKMSYRSIGAEWREDWDTAVWIEGDLMKYTDDAAGETLLFGFEASSRDG